jgi:peroxiredoxin
MILKLKNNIFSKLALLSIFLSFPVIAASQNDEPNKPIPDSAQQMLKRANDLADREKFFEAAAEAQKAIVKAPNFLQAHIKYINVKAYFMEQYDEVKAEYETLTTKNPSNPVYPAALAAALFTESPANKNRWFEAVIKLAPDWAWSHYAQSQLMLEKEPETAAAELLKMIEKESDAPQPYTQVVFILESRLKKFDDAIAVSEKMVRQKELRASGQSNLWRLRYNKAKGSEEAKAALRRELSQVAATSNDIALLAAARSAYTSLLKDKDAAQSVEQKIKRLDPTWYPERGTIQVMMVLDVTGPRSDFYAGRQIAILNKMPAFDADSQEQITQLEYLLTLNPNAKLKKTIYHRLINLAVQTKNHKEAVKYGDALLKVAPEDSSILSLAASLLADQKLELDKALGYARRAEELSREFQPVKDLSLVAGKKGLEEYYAPEKQKERHNALRARVLDAYGWVLFRMGKANEAETKIREAVELNRSEKNLSHLSEVLRSLYRIEEADRFALEAKNEYVAGIRRKFKNEPSKDFELSTLDNRRVKLSDLKDKIVMVNFWATWCKPCVQEMPVFINIYNKYKNQGFEILAITVDDTESRPLVAKFAKQHNLNFPVLYDEGVAKLYNVHAYPTTFFIDRKGNIRYQSLGFNIENAERDLEIIIEELMKDS